MVKKHMKMKKILSMLLACVMMLSLMPRVVLAEDSTSSNVYDVGVDGLEVTVSGRYEANQYGELQENKPTTEGFCTPRSNLNQLEVQLGGYTTERGREKQTAVYITLRNNRITDATLKFEYEMDFSMAGYEEEENRGSIASSDKLLTGTNGIYEQVIPAGEELRITYISPYGENYSVLKLTNISLRGENDNKQATTTFEAAVNGSYTVNGNALTGDTTAAAGTEYQLVATAADGYQFLGWKVDGVFASYAATFKYVANRDQTVCPEFVSNEVLVFGVDDAKYTNLQEADTAAKNAGGRTIVLLNDGVLTGEYTISAGNTLLIPYDDANSVHIEATSTASMNNNPAWETPRAYRTLTMAQGAKLTIEGALNVGGKHSAGPNMTAGAPTGDLGMIQMAEGANITVADGGVLYCWGYIYGDGAVTIEDGGVAHENFQFSDFRGGTATLAIAQTFIVFPMTQYYVQNIEVATTYEHGATEYVWGSVFMSNNPYSTSVKFIGDDPNLSMFVPGKNGSVTKTYDPKTDRLVIDVEGDSSINPMAVELGGTAINTATFVLPINSNMTININSGITQLNQSLALLPGAKLTIAEGATLSIMAAEPLKYEDGTYVHYTGGNNLIIYDRDQWLEAYQPVMDESGTLIGANKVDAHFVYTKSGMKRLQPVAYSPTRSYTRTEENLQDAVVDINGTLITEGFIYTTVDVDLIRYFTTKEVSITGGGAAVMSSKGTGVLAMNNGFGMDFITLQPIQKGEFAEFAYLPMVSARLQNADGSYVDTLGAGDNTVFNYCADCGKWYAGEVDKHKIDITWIVDGVDGTQEVCMGVMPIFAGGVPEKEGYEFIGWSTGNDNVPEYTAETLPNATTDATYYACFAEKSVGLKGDLNGNGDVDADDLTLLARHIAGIELLTGQALQDADVDGNGEVDADDLTTHARYIAGIIEEWPEN